MANLIRSLGLILLFATPAAAQEVMSPDEWLVRANEQYLAGDSDGAAISALKVLDLGRKRSNPGWIGGALTVLCRTALLDGNAESLRIFTDELQALVEATGDQQWSGVVDEMNAALNGM